MTKLDTLEDTIELLTKQMLEDWIYVKFLDTFLWTNYNVI